YGRLVNVTSHCGTRKYVAPNSSATSYLSQVIRNTASCTGRMPDGGLAWSAASIQMLDDWINAGAPNN
ncbi:MAG: PE-PGRS family protein, partial [bacterium]